MKLGTAFTQPNKKLTAILVQSLAVDTDSRRRYLRTKLDSLYNVKEPILCCFFLQVVLSPVEGGPAARAGIRKGDQLVKVDGLALSGVKGEEVAQKLRGKAGTTVRITIRRLGGETEQVGYGQIFS
jgi:membrane-associated protease RseP (regulator of RpoE activity)